MNIIAVRTQDKDMPLFANLVKAYLSDAELHKFTTRRGYKEALILHWQYRAIRNLYNNKTFSD